MVSTIPAGAGASRGGEIIRILVEMAVLFPSCDTTGGLPHWYDVIAARKLHYIWVGSVAAALIPGKNQCRTVAT